MFLVFIQLGCHQGQRDTLELLGFFKHRLDGVGFYVDDFFQEFVLSSCRFVNIFLNFLEL